MRILAPSRGRANPVTRSRDTAWPQASLRAEVPKGGAANHLINQQNDVSTALIIILPRSGSSGSHPDPRQPASLYANPESVPARSAEWTPSPSADRDNWGTPWAVIVFTQGFPRCQSVIS